MAGERSLPDKVLWNGHNESCPFSAHPGQARLPRKYQVGIQIAKIHGDTDILPAHRNPAKNR